MQICFTCNNAAIHNNGLVVIILYIYPFVNYSELNPVKSLIGTGRLSLGNYQSIFLLTVRNSAAEASN